MANASHNSRYARLSAAFAASAFALLVVATVQHRSAEIQMAQITGRPSVESNEYQYKRIKNCGTDVRESKQRSAARACSTLRQHLNNR